MAEMKEKGVYVAPKPLMETMQRRFAAYCATDAEAVEVIGRVWREHGYLLDPHTAVAWAAMEKYREETGDETCTVVLSTASPYKFPKDVLRAVGGEAPEDGFEAMDRLYELTGEPIPANLSGLRGRKARFDDCIDASDMCAYVQKAVAE